MVMTHVTLPAFPAQALRDRLGSNPDNLPWASYLPAQLRFNGHKVSQVGSPTGTSSSVISSSEDFQAPESSEPAWYGSLTGRVWALSRDPHGCRLVQQALEIGSGVQKKAGFGEEDQDAAVLYRQRCAQIALELKGHIPEALRCPHANHVVQKIISSIPPLASQFIIDELTPRADAIVYASRHKYGCRIVQRLIQYCLPHQTRELIEILLVDAVASCKHPYGNYVMQYLLAHGTADQKLRLLSVIEDNVADIAQDNHGCAVITTAMSRDDPHRQISLAQAILKTPGLLQSMTRTKHGHLAAKLVFRALPEGADQEAARSGLV